MFMATFVTFFYLAVIGAIFIPGLVLLGYVICRRLPIARLPMLAAIGLAPLLSPETLAGWFRFFHGQNPGGPNGALMVMHLALVLIGSAVLLPGAVRSQT